MLLEGPLNFLAVKFSLECCACCSYVPKWALSAFTATGKNTEQSKTYPKKEPLTSHMNLSRNYLIEWMRAKRRRSKDQLIVNICFDYRFAARVSRFSGFLRTCDLFFLRNSQLNSIFISEAFLYIALVRFLGWLLVSECVEYIRIKSYYIKSGKHT